jgi:hypothetical protein
MPSIGVGKGALALMALGAVLAAVALGYEFYAPLVGTIAAGEVQEAKPQVPRDRAVVKVEAYMLEKGKQGLPTLADVIRFHGLERDTIPCSVQENHGEAASPAAITVLANRPLKVGEEVMLCLD